MTLRRLRWASIETTTAAILVSLGVVFAIGALREGLGSMADSGPGLFPFLVAVVLIAAGFAVLVQELRGTAHVVPADEDDDDFQGEIDWIRIAGVLLAALAVPILGETVGLISTLSVATVLMAKVMGMRGWIAPIIFGALFGLATWLVFVQWLYVPLPSGTLGLV